MAPAKDVLRSQQPSVTLEQSELSTIAGQELAINSSNIVDKQAKRSILSAKDTLRDIIIAEFDQRLNIMQNDITKNVITTLTSLIQLEFAKMRLNLLLSASISTIEELSQASTTSQLFALSSLSTVSSLSTLSFLSVASKLRCYEPSGI